MRCYAFAVPSMAVITMFAVWKQLQLNKQEHGVALPLPHIILPVKTFFLL